MNDHETVTDVADAYLAQLAAVEPRAAEALGRDDVLAIPDLSPESYEERAAVARRAASRLASATAAKPADQVLRSALADRLASDVALHEIGFTTALLAPLATPVHLVRQVFDGLPRRTEDDWTTVVAHLVRVPIALRQYAATLDASARRGHVVARRTLGRRRGRGWRRPPVPPPRPRRGSPGSSVPTCCRGPATGTVPGGRCTRSPRRPSWARTSTSRRPTPTGGRSSPP